MARYKAPVFNADTLLVDAREKWTQDGNKDDHIRKWLEWAKIPYTVQALNVGDVVTLQPIAYVRVFGAAVRPMLPRVADKRGGEDRRFVPHPLTASIRIRHLRLGAVPFA